LLAQTITGKRTNSDVDLSLTDQLAIALDAGEPGDAEGTFGGDRNSLAVDLLRLLSARCSFTIVLLAIGL
jgi:hypothetical protein